MARLMLTVGDFQAWVSPTTDVRTRILARAIVHLYNNLDEPVPADLQALLRKEAS